MTLAALNFGIVMILLASGCEQIAPPAGNAAAPTQTQQVERQVPLGSPGQAIASFAPVVKKAAPAVVTIRSARVVRAPQQYPFLDDPRFRDFFGQSFNQTQQRQAPIQVQRGLGSGVVVSPDGYILTNHHVVDGAEQIVVEFIDRRSFEAHVVGSDPPSDLAVLKIDAHYLAVLPLADSDAVEVGDIALALGNPLGLAQTVTAGIISAKGRSTGLSDGSFEDFLQTDAPINQGNSGGALINSAGNLIGINSQILSPTGGNIGIGFAIPSNMAKNVMEQLIRNGSVRRAQLGVAAMPLTSSIARILGLNEIRGAVVEAVQPGSAAQQAGIQTNDVITALNGQPVNDSNDLRNRIANLQPGTGVTITIVRGGREQQVNVKLGELSTRRSG